MNTDCGIVLILFSITPHIGSKEKTNTFGKNSKVRKKKPILLEKLKGLKDTKRKQHR